MIVGGQDVWGGQDNWEVRMAVGGQDNWEFRMSVVAGM